MEEELCIHDWVCEHNLYFCILCGNTSSKKPSDYIETIENIENDKEDNIEKCKHVWECLRDRCHNRGKGKYQAYKCKICGKFQRR